MVGTNSATAIDSTHGIFIRMQLKPLDDVLQSKWVGRLISTTSENSIDCILVI